MFDMILSQVIRASDIGHDYGPADAVSAVVGGRVMLYTLWRNEREVVAFELTDTGLVETGRLALAGDWRIGARPALGIAAGLDDPALTVEGLNGDTRIGLAGDGTPASQGAHGALTAPVSATGWTEAGIGWTLSGRADGGGIDLWRDDGTGAVWSAALEGAENPAFADITDTALFHVGGQRLMAVLSGSADSVAILRADTGGLAALDVQGPASGLPINDPVAVVAAGDFLVVASRLSQSLTVLSVAADGRAQLRDHVLDDTRSLFGSAATLAAVDRNGATFLAAAGAEGGVSLLTVLPNGRLVAFGTLADDGGTTLYRPTSLDWILEGGVLSLAVGSEWDGGLSTFAVAGGTPGAVLQAAIGGTVAGGPGDDTLMGSDAGDDLNGAAGRDILFDGSGADVLTGGPGADLFVFARDDLADTVTDFERGLDRLDLSAFDFLYDRSGIEFIPQPDGITLAFGDEVIRLRSKDGAPLSASDFTNDDLFNLDRPTIASSGQALKGGPGDDLLQGGNGEDTVEGADGADTLTGGSAGDRLMGQRGDDWLEGGDGADRLEGNAGRDTLIGGLGDDILWAGAGGGLLIGDDATDWDWS